MTEYFDFPVLEVLLMAVFFLSLFVEIKTGGMGAGVLLGLTAAGVFFGSRYMQGLVDFYQIGIFLLGVICISVEILMPTVGLLAGLGVAAMLYSFVLAMGGDVNALYALLIALGASLVFFAAIVKKLPSSKLWSKFVLADKSTKEKGFVSAEGRDFLVGKTGLVLTELRPSGTAEVDGAPVDVVSEGAYIEKGEKVTIIAVNGSRVVVRKTGNETEKETKENL